MNCGRKLAFLEREREGERERERLDERKEEMGRENEMKW